MLKILLILYQQLLLIKHCLTINIQFYIYLRFYSADLNPIKIAFSMLKLLIKKAKEPFICFKIR